MIKGSIQEKDITIVNIYAPNIGAPQYIRQTLTYLKGEIDSNTIVGDFNTPLTPMDRSSKQKINKETQVLNDTLDEMDLIGIFRTFHPNAEVYTFFSSVDFNTKYKMDIHVYMCSVVSGRRNTKRRPLYMLSTRNPLQTSRHI